MLSSKAVGKSETPSIHSAAVANLDALFERAILGWSKPDSEGDVNIKAIHRFFAPVLIDGRAFLAKMTVKETAQESKNNPLYTVEAVSFEATENPAAQWVGEIASADGADPRTIRSAGLIESMAQRVQNFNPSNVSKVTDPETGEPMVVYHGTVADIDAFTAMPGSDAGFHFGSLSAAQERLAKLGMDGQNIMPAFIVAERPLSLRDLGRWDDHYLLRRNLIDAGLPVDQVKAMVSKLDDVESKLLDQYEDDEKVLVVVQKATAEMLHDLLVRNGYDSIVYQNQHEAKGSTSFAVFSPTQIKSAIGNTGEFNPENPDIRHSRGQPSSTLVIGRTGNKATDYVTVNGSTEFGRVTAEDVLAAKASGETLKEGPIRLSNGKHFRKNEGFGLVHVNAEHAQDIAGSGYQDAVQFIHGVISNADQIWRKKDGRLIFYRTGKRQGMTVVELRESEDGYSVITAYPVDAKKQTALQNDRKRGLVELVVKGRRPPIAGNQLAGLPEPLTGNRQSTVLNPALEPLADTSNGSNLLATNHNVNLIESAVRDAVGPDLAQHITVVQTAEEAQAMLGKDAEPLLSDKAGGIDAQTEGFFDPSTGRIVLIADNLSDPARAKWVAWHELYHRGLFATNQGDARLLKYNLERLSREVGLLDRLAAAMAEQRPELRGNLGLAREEAAVELGAALEQRDLQSLRDRYGVTISKLLESGLLYPGGKLSQAVGRFMDFFRGLVAKITGQSFDSATALRSFLNEAKAHMGDGLGADKKHDARLSGNGETPLQSKSYSILGRSFDEAKAIFLSAFPEGGGYFKYDSGPHSVRAAKAFSDAARRDIGAESTNVRTVPSDFGCVPKVCCGVTILGVSLP